MEDKVWAKITQCRFGHLRNWAKKLKKTLRTTTIVHHIHGGPAGTALVPKPATGTIELSTFITAIRTSTRAAPVGGLVHFKSIRLGRRACSNSKVWGSFTAN